IDNVKITKQPTLNYSNGEKLDLSALTVDLNYKTININLGDNKEIAYTPNSIIGITYDKFSQYKLTTDFNNGQLLSSNNNNQSIMVTYNNSITTVTDPLKVTSIVNGGNDTDNVATPDNVKDGNHKDKTVEKTIVTKKTVVETKDTKKEKSAKTGDMANVLGLLFLLAGAATVSGAILRRKH
ncbi:MAG: hypothetical protein LBM02_02175, partial [Lachnospiraceae bacterium]|nr:hypothetical protein [Lachnospiraceae bacterium]